jgi:hypothetical protein
VRIRILKTLMAAALIWGTPARADAQQRDRWEVSVVPYLWLMATDGALSAGQVTVPVFLKFADAADSLDGALSFHFEASRGRWGVLTDLNVIRLSSSSTFTLAGRTIEGEFELDNVMFELGGSFLVNEKAGFGLIGGLRTYTLSPKLQFRGTNTGATPIDTSDTSPNAFVGFVIRQRFREKWAVFGRADLGAGDADFTWSGMVGFEYRVTSWGGLEFGFKGLGIDVKSDDRIVREYDVTHYGPIAGFRFHWGK